MEDKESENAIANPTEEVEVKDVAIVKKKLVDKVNLMFADDEDNKKPLLKKLKKTKQKSIEKAFNPNIDVLGDVSSLDNN